MWIPFVLAILLIIFAYFKLRANFQYWSSKGVSQNIPTLLVGDIFNFVLRRQTALELVEGFYNLDKNVRYMGLYQFFSPILFIRDPEVIKQITVKDFDHFLDHRHFVSRKVDPLFGTSLFLLKGQEWRDMRSSLSPSFTSSKMKYLFSLMVKNSDQFVNHFLEKNEEMVKVEMKDALTRFANDVIANTIFGFECDSLKQRENEFYLMGKEATEFKSFRKMFVFFGNILMPKILEIFNVRFFPKVIGDYFSSIVKENIKSREDHGVIRPDMITLLLESRKNKDSKEEDYAVPDAGFATAAEFNHEGKAKKKYITDDNIASQAFVFFFAGFDSVSSLMCFMAYELGINQDAQSRLREEVDEINEKCEGNLTYEAITTMKYMDMVVSETLRKWPNAIATDRLCTKPITIKPVHPNEKPLHLQKGDIVILPMFAIQRDPKYFPEPDRFIPERFSDENKHKINPYTYFPFGLGPRNCIGSRFALLETKILFFKLLCKFEIHPVEETQIPIRFSKKAINMTAEKGFWLGLRRRN